MDILEILKQQLEEEMRNKDAPKVSIESVKILQEKVQPNTKIVLERMSNGFKCEVRGEGVSLLSLLYVAMVTDKNLCDLIRAALQTVDDAKKYGLQ
ncbi:MAG TPA: hypothetical protein VK255_01175 [Patescibacteria group bacterium]|nr:hypothetical protein [Patescibacteria group bacterium]